MRATSAGESTTSSAANSSVVMLPAVTADPRFAAGYRSRAEAKLDIGRSQDAIEDLSRAIAFDVSNAELYLLRGQIGRAHV